MYICIRLFVYRFYLIRIISVLKIVKIARKYRPSEHMKYDITRESVYVKQA